MAYARHSFARIPGKGGALLSVSWSRPCLQMLVNFEIRAAIQDIKSTRKRTNHETEVVALIAIGLFGAGCAVGVYSWAGS